MPPDAPRWGAGFKRAVKANFNHTLNVYAHTTALPIESNSISLDPNMKDAWGMPALRVTSPLAPSGRWPTALQTTSAAWRRTAAFPRRCEPNSN